MGSGIDGKYSLNYFVELVISLDRSRIIFRVFARFCLGNDKVLRSRIIFNKKIKSLVKM